MDKKSLVSIIIPFYNCEKYIKRCIDSVINQTYTNIEIILINDGSTDNSFKVVASYNDKRIRYFEQKNMGPSAARNVGLDHFNGNYVMFLDGDDEYELFFVKSLYEKITIFKADIAIGMCKRKNINWCVDSKDRPFKKVIVDNNILLSDESEPHYSCMYNSKVLQNVRFDLSIKHSEDWLFYKTALLYANTILYVNSIGYIYWDNGETSLAWGNFDYYKHLDKMHSSIYAHIVVYQKLLNRGINGYYFIEQSVRILLGCFYGLYKNNVSFMKADYKKEVLYIKPFIKNIRRSRRLFYKFLLNCPYVYFLMRKLLNKR